MDIMAMRNSAGRKKSPNGRMIVVSICLPKELIDRLTVSSSKNNSSISNMAREFIIEGLDRESANTADNNLTKGE
jgi:metal-responsive CopG/Arc/MetJ family transcriptional regulator